MAGDDVEWRTDAIAQRLSALADRVEAEVGAAVEVRRGLYEQGHIVAVDLFPSRESAVRVGWLDMGDDCMVSVGSTGLGGRWELDRTPAEVDFIEEVVWAVVAGAVTEIFGPGRSRVDVRLADGSTVSETGADPPRGCLPLPGWIKRGRRINYAPYRDADNG